MPKKGAHIIQRPCYAMTGAGGEDAEITLYGEIVSERPTDWWTGAPLEGDYIVLGEFLDDLERAKSAKRITLRIHSLGGDVFAAIAIHNRLRELKGKLTVIVDGVAMSGGSLIMCAADAVKVNPSSLIMIHNCMALLMGWYNTEELAEVIASNGGVDRAQAAIYRTKTGRDEDEILEMMRAETYMTGAEAVEKGFADELTDGTAAIAASADRSTLYVNGRAIRSAFAYRELPEGIPMVETVEQTAEIQTETPEQSGQNEGGEQTMARSLEELRAENPELAAALMEQAQAAANGGAQATAAEEERQRIRDIDEVAALYPDEIVRQAKYGDNPCTAQELTYRAALEMSRQGKRFAAMMEEDTGASGVQAVAAVPGAETGRLETAMTAEQKMSEARKTVKSLWGSEKEV